MIVLRPAMMPAQPRGGRDEEDGGALRSLYHAQWRIATAIVCRARVLRSCFASRIRKYICECWSCGLDVA